MDAKNFKSELLAIEKKLEQVRLGEGIGKRQARTLYFELQRVARQYEAAQNDSGQQEIS
jgi:hypothetical protein